MDNLYNTALSYVGCPHVNRGNLKGVGLDCCTIIAHIIKETRGKEIEINFNYSGDWFCKRNCEEILLPYLEKYFSRTDEPAPGDVISFRWGRAKYAHLAMVIDNQRVVHCSADSGVEITRLNNPYFTDGQGRSRVTGYWRLKE